MVRVRFAPSPTGYLHIGGARTALFNWLYARHVGGTFLLRIEDTDRERSTKESTDAIFEALEWMGIDWDEDVLTQSTRHDEHVAAVQKLLDDGKAYKCFATTEDIAAMRERAMKEGRTRVYERTWRDRTDHPDGQPYTVRFKMPVVGTTTIRDHVLGEITLDNDDLDDLIILRSDGTPTYNFVVVCDDAFMEVSHVVRGQDHMTNTFRQWHIYEALGFEPPEFGHLPLVDGLSKRKGSAGVQHYRDQGFVTEGLNNYIARLGWSHGDQEIFSMTELVDLFDLPGVNKGNSNYDEQKMRWVNSQWIQRLEPADLAERLLPFLAKQGVEAEVDDRLVMLVSALQPRSETLVEMAEQALFPYRKPTEYNAKSVKKWMKANSATAYDALIDALADLDEVTLETLEATITGVAEAHELKLGKIAQPIRVALTGSSVSPPIYETVFAVGRDETVERLRAARHLFPEPAP